MNFNDYFDPVSIKKPDNYNVVTDFAFGRNISIHTPNAPVGNISGFDIAIIGVSEERNAVYKSCAEAPDIIRNKLYLLQAPDSTTKIIDLGNFKIGISVTDTYIGMRDVTCELIKNNVLPIIIGGSHDLTYALAMAYEKLKKQFSIITIDSKIDIENFTEDLNSKTFLNKIFNQKKYLFNYTNIGHQTCLVNKNQITQINDMLFDLIRLGEIQEDIREAEPVVRDADILSIDINAIRQPDAPGQKDPSPNGFYGEDVCQIAKYAGLSDRLSSFGIFEITPDFDINNQTSHLAAQIIWYFIQGYYERKKDFPVTDIKKYTKYIVTPEKLKHDIIFYKSPYSGRWWIEISEIKNNRKHYIACSNKDYLNSCKGEIPDRWWKAFQKIN